MSELIEQKNNTAPAKWQLLASVSALALIANAVTQAKAEDSDRPTVWIEAGVQLDRLTNGQESFAPPFVTTLLENPFTPPAAVQKTPLYSFGEEGRLSFTPAGSDWVFSASLRYGRANSSGSKHEETSLPSPVATVSSPTIGYHASGVFPPSARRFADSVSRTDQSHAVLDFLAGKDVGLGIFGGRGSSAINFGLRFAQFSSHSTSSINADPNFSISYKYFGTPDGPHRKIPKISDWDLYKATVERTHSFTGIGPALEWDFSATLAGHPDATAVSLDWGVNGAILFGRQKARVQHQTSSFYKSKYHKYGQLPVDYQTARGSVRSRSIIVPNVGGFAGVSLRFPNAKVSLGYRADFFFGAMDGGIDTRKTYDRNFYGPFATISIGLGG